MIVETLTSSVGAVEVRGSLAIVGGERAKAAVVEGSTRATGTISYRLADEYRGLQIPPLMSRFLLLLLLWILVSPL